MSDEPRDQPRGEPALQGRNVDEMSFTLSSRRTRLSFQRTRMSADRTLMSIIRTALSLIGFGFTIFQFFHALRESAATRGMVGSHAARNFGLSLVVLGILLLVLGIVGHVRFMLELRHEHGELVRDRLIPHDRLPFSVTLGIAVLLLLVGLATVVSMLTRLGPFD